jgi:hypothetical protein
MMSDEPMGDPVMEELAGLTRLAPDERRAERTRGRCRAALARGRRRGRESSRGACQARGRLLGPVLIASVCIVYLSEVARRALQLYGF